MTMTRAYTALDPAARTLHQLLALFPGKTFTVEAAAALADLSRIQAQEVLDHLVGHHLLTHTAGRYRQRPRARAHALSASLDVPAPDTGSALHRILTWYLHTASAGSTALDPHRWHSELPPTPQPTRVFSSNHAMLWFAEELDALRMGMRLAADTGHPRLCWQLHEATLAYLRLYRSFTVWQQTVTWARGTARAAADTVGQAVTATSQATLTRALGHTEYAAQEYAHALELWDATGHMPGYVNTLIEYGHLEVRAGRGGRARLKFTEAVELCRTDPDTSMDLELRARAGLGQAALDMGEATDALACFRDIIEASSAAPGLRLRALTGMATAHLLRADPVAAAHALQRADLLIPLVSDPVASADTDLIRAHLHAEDPVLHRAHLVRAYTVLRSVGDPRANAVQAQRNTLQAP